MNTYPLIYAIGNQTINRRYLLISILVCVTWAASVGNNLKTHVPPRGAY